MTSRNRKGALVRTAAAAVGACVLSSLAFTGTSLGAAPPAGAACVPSDGKITGRGASFQTKASAALIAGYTSDVCGPVASDPVAGANMLAYNAAYTAGFTGSGHGQLAASCRTDAYGGSDIPYDEATLTTLNGAPGTLSNSSGTCASFSLTQPFQPTPAPYPGPNDTTVPMMSFPVAGSSVAMSVNLTSCAHGALQFSHATLARIIGGTALTWGDASIVADNPGLSGCTTPITRVVRLDKSGTTQVFKKYLKNAEAAGLSSATCDGSTWGTLAQDANNTTWPTGTNPPCSALTRPTSTGGGALVTLLKTIDGGFGYADLADAVGVTNASVQNSSNTSFQSPGLLAANCTFATTLPGSNNADAVGLNATGDNWATDAATNHEDTTFKGDAYPICGLTFDFVYTGLHDTSGGANAISRLTADQRRTLYSYFTYVFSPAAQSRLTGIKYASVPVGFLTKLRLGFQAGF